MNKPNSGHRFSYPLACLLKKHQWEEQTLRQELATAQDALRRLEEEAAALQALVVDANDQLARLRDGEHTMDLAREGRLIAYRDTQDALLAQTRQQTQKASALHQQVQEQLAGVRNAVNGHENFRDRLLQEHRRLLERAAANRADDEWLLRRQWLEAQP